MIPYDPELLAAAEQALREQAAELGQDTTYPPFLTPVQAWLLNYIDRPTLLDRVIALEESELKSQAEALGRAQADEAYAADLLKQARDAIDAWMDGKPAGPNDVPFREYQARRENARQATDHATRLARLDGSRELSPEMDDALLAGEEALRRQGTGQAADQLHGVWEQLVEAQAAYAMYAALTDPVDEAIRERESDETGIEPSAPELRAEFAEVREELGLESGSEPEAER